MTVQMTESVKIDSRKFLSMINDSAQAKIAFFEERIKEMGQKANKSFRLAMLQPTELVFEDTKTNEYFLANHAKKDGKVEITKIRPIEIFDNEKKSLYFESCLKLVNAIEENDQRKMAESFNRMKAQRFSSKIIPEHGIVVGRDGVSRKINVKASALSESKKQIVEAVVDNLKDKVVVENNMIVSAYFNDGEQVSLPVSKWSGRKLVAKTMRESAKQAYLSPGFQNRIAKTAKSIFEGKVEDAVHTVKDFLVENEEFTLLTKKEIQTLIENTLATKAVFNQQLCEDTATLVYRTNLKVNKDTILNEWLKIGKACEHPVLIENVHKLEESKKFEATYDHFLKMIFEAISNREIAAEALATTLDSLKTKTPRIQESHDLSSKLTNLVTKLRSKDCDDNAINEAEDLIATIQEELSAQDTLQDYDNIPGDEPTEAPVGAPAAPQAPVITINSPLISIGGKPEAGAVEGGTMETGDQDLAGLGLDETEDLGAGADLAGAAAPAPAAPMGQAQTGEAQQVEPEVDPLAAEQPTNRPGMPRSKPPIGQNLPESKGKGKAMNESRPVHPEMQATGKEKVKRDGDHAGDNEALAEDRYSFAEKINLIGLNEYGRKVIPEHKLGAVRKFLKSIKEGTGLQRIAKACAQAGITLSEHDMGMAMDQMREFGHEEEEPEIETCEMIEPEGFEGAEETEDTEHGNIETDLQEIKDTLDSIDGKLDSMNPEATEEDGFQEGQTEEGPSEDDFFQEDEEELPEAEEGVAESQYKFPTAKKKVGVKSYKKDSYGRKTVAEGKIKWLEKDEDAILGEAKNVQFILDHGSKDPQYPPALLSTDGQIQIPIPEVLHEDVFKLVDQNLVSDRLHNHILRNINILKPISEEEEVEIDQTVLEIQKTQDGNLKVKALDPTVEVETAEMEPVDSVVTPTQSMGQDDDGEMPDFGGEEEVAPSQLDVEDGEEPEMEQEEPEGEEFEDESEDEESEDEEPEDEPEDEETFSGVGDHEGLAEDNDLTSPKHNAYKGLLNQDPRQMPEHKMPSKNKGDQEEGFGSTRNLKKIDKNGNTPNVKHEE